MTSDTEKCAHGERLLAVATVPGSAKLMDSDLKSKNSKVKTNSCWRFSGGSNPPYSALVSNCVFCAEFWETGAHPTTVSSYTYIKKSFLAIQSTFRSVEMHSKGRY